MWIRAAGVDIFAKDQGRGRSASPEGMDFSFAGLGNFLDQLVEALRSPLPLNLVAHDFGGAFGMAWAVQHVERFVASL